MSYIIYDWTEVRNATDSLYKRLLGVEVDNFVKVVCNNNLPNSILHVLAAACVYGVTKEDEDVKKVINAYLQLADVGYIGHKE